MNHPAQRAELGARPSARARAAWAFTLHLLASAAMAAEEPDRPAAAQELPRLTQFQQVLDLGLDGARQRRHWVEATGVVTLATGNPIIVQDDTAACAVTLTNRPRGLAAGHKVRVRGLAAPNMLAAGIDFAQVDMLEPGVFPEPIRAPVSRLATLEYFGRWIEVEGVVRDIIIEGFLKAMLASEGQRVWVHLPAWPRHSLPASWIDARVRLRGVCWLEVDGAGHPKGFFLRVPMTNQIEFLSPTATDPFTQSRLPLGSSGLKKASDFRLRTGGTVLHHSPKGDVFLRDDSGALRARLLVPFPPVTVRSVSISRPRVADLQPGEVVELVGAPTTTAFAPSLLDAEVRRVGTNAAPQAAVVRAEAGLSGRYDCDLITLEARIVGKDTRAAAVGRLRTEVLALQSRGISFEATWETLGTNSLPRVAENTLVRLTGICLSRPATPTTSRAFTLHLRSPADLVVLGRAPVWETFQPGRILAVAGAVGAVALVWIWQLRRQVRQRTSALQESEAKFRALYEGASTAVILHDERGIVDCNPATLRILGYSCRAEILGKHPGDISPPVQPDGNASVPAAQQHIARALATGSHRFEWVSRRGDGTPVPVEIVLTPVQLNGRTLLQALVQDISERKRAESELHRAVAREKELGELKSRFVSMVSHEFRTPLSIIMSSAEILHDYLERLSPERRAEHLRDIAQCAQHMGGMMEDVLLLSRVEAGRLQCKPAALELAGFGRRLVDEVVSTTGQRCPIQLSVPAEWPEVRADESLLRHIFINLLTNAVKYSPASSPVKFLIKTDAHGTSFTVRDRGIGIPEADRRQLFQAFYRGGNVGETPGTGLGLIIVKHCVELHGGKLAFESTEGTGTTFVVELPVFAFPAAAGPRDDLKETNAAD